jgi:hypothetical protein
MAKVNVRNTPPLQRGDRVEVVTDNHVLWESVGKTGVLRDYFSHSSKWGIEMDDGEMVTIRKGNLKRINRW